MSEETTYTEEDFVYVDPKNKKIMGKVEWQNNGKAKPMEIVFTEEPETEEQPGDKKFRRRPRKKKKQYYPWCSYKTAKKVYHVEGKFKGDDEYEKFDTVFEKALVEPYWD